MDACFLPADFLVYLQACTGFLHARSNWRWAPLLTGMLFAQGRRTVSSWLRAGDLGKDFRNYYYFLGSVGRKAQQIAVAVLFLVVRRLAPGGRLRLALDDSPTKRFGPCVEGAGIHHNPTPGPAGAKLLYGHLWVTLAVLGTHPQWGAIGLPILALLYVRAQDVAALAPWTGWRFHTRFELAASLLEWAACLLQGTGLELWVAADGAYAKRPFLKRAAQAGGRVDSGGAGAGGARLGGVLLHGARGQRGGDPGDGGRSGEPGASVP